MAQSDHALDDVTTNTAADLARQIASGELSACEVIDYYIQRIQQVDARLNAMVVPMWEQARQEARRADEERARGQRLGPLHGVPVTIKEMFDVTGTATTAGLSCRATHRARSDAGGSECSVVPRLQWPRPARRSQVTSSPSSSLSTTKASSSI